MAGPGGCETRSVSAPSWRRWQEEGGLQCNSFVNIFGDLLILSWSGETIKSVPAFVKTPHLEGFRASDWDFSPLHN